MSRRISDIPVLASAQAQAADPNVHASLSASAGTGKTQVLTARVLRLLLDGAPPSSILCLTYTKAGAAEMANRIAERLAHWVRLSDAALGMELTAIHHQRSPGDIQKARRLFAEVLDAPGGGLQIQTIHSFAQSLLASFPEEAGIAPGLQPIEGRAEQELARKTLAALLTQAEGSGVTGLIDDVSALSLRLGEEGAESYLLRCAHAAGPMEALGDPAEIEAKLLRFIGVESGDIDAELDARLSDDAIDLARIDRLREANRTWGTSTGKKIVANLDAIVSAPPHERRGMLKEVGSGLVKADGTPRKVEAKQIAADPDYAELLDRFTNWLVELRTLVAAGEAAKVQAAGLRAGQAFAAAYAKAKRLAGVADFDDLIEWTRSLLEQPGMGDWVRYKLDRRTDHVLVDEAQDTNQDQWAIVRALIAEFFSGSAEVDERWRTLFMVGDFKQAIYGFQGTDPRQYESFRTEIAALSRDLEVAAAESDVLSREFRQLSIDASFRSSPAVLELVDEVIGDVGFSAMGLQEPPNPHRAHFSDRPGRVELWPPFDVDAVEGDIDEGDEGEEGWIGEADRLYADAIARQVKGWLSEAPVLASTGRPLTAGDILILVRSRSELASLIVARLYRHMVPVAGIDRLHLHRPLAVRDLLAAIGFAVQPLDDLGLANVLVSPLIGWDQQTLYDLAQGRQGGLWAALQRRRDERPDFKEAHRILSEWLAMADYVTPGRFLESILSGPLDGRRKLIGRLGEAARDPIAELVASALEFERDEIASLDRFLSWFSKGDVEVKRDPSASSDAVRVMTVHGAKGLEAPVVLLADATHDPAKVGGTSSVMEIDIPDVGRLPLLRPRKDEAAPVFRLVLDHQKLRDLEEHWRLAYVGLTRARERLIISGRLPSRGVPSTSWHAASERALSSLGAQPVAMEGWGEALVWEGRARATRKTGKARRVIEPISLPSWVRTAAPPEARPPKPLTPSQLVEDLDSLPPPTPAMRDAARRGTLIHALFERLPATAPDRRMELALRWLERNGVIDAGQREEMARAACSIIADPANADLFGPQSLGEAPIAATLADGTVVAGTVDRLVIHADRVELVDFKTGNFVPASAALVPDHHRKQMEAYRSALEVIFPGRVIEASLLYTSGPTLIALTN